MQPSSRRLLFTNDLKVRTVFYWNVNVKVTFLEKKYYSKIFVLA